MLQPDPAFMPKIDLSVWKELAPPPLPRAGCAVGVIDDELVVAGGTFWHEGRKFWSERVDAFDPVVNQWSARSPMPRTRGDAAALAHAGALYVFGGGAEGAAATDVWILRDNLWTAPAHLALPAPRRSSSVVVIDGTFYLLGGLSGTGSEFSLATSTVWAAKPDGRWEPRSPMPGPSRFNLSVGVVGGRIIVAGGCAPEHGSVRNLDEVIAYDPSTDNWTVLGRLPFANRAGSGLADESGLLIFGGYTDKFESGILRYDVPGGAADTVGQLPVGLAGGHFVRIGSQLLGVTGENGIKMRFPGLLGAA